MRSSSIPYRLSRSALAILVTASACGDEVPLYDFPRAMCGETAIQGAQGATKTSVSSTTLTVSDDERVFWVEDTYARNNDEGVIHAGALAGGDDAVLATDTLVPTQIEVDDQQVYWGGGSTGGEGTAIKAVDKHGGPARIVATIEAGDKDRYGRIICQGGLVCPYRFAVDATDIYYSANNTLRRVDKRRANSVPVELTTGLIRDVAVDATDVYWVECSSDPATSVVRKLSKSGGTPKQLAAVDGGFDCTTSTLSNRLVLDEGNVYWAKGPAVYSVPKAGGPTTTIDTGGNYITSLAVTPTAFYMVTGGSSNGGPYPGGSMHHGLLRSSRTGGGLVDIVPPRDDHSGSNDASCDALVVTADTKNVYWVVQGGVIRRPLESTPQ